MHDHLVKMQQAKQNLDSVVYQKQQLAAEQSEIERALEELRSGEGRAYKQAGPVLVESDRPKLVAELEETQALAKTKQAVLEKQEARMKESLSEYESKARELARQ